MLPMARCGVKWGVLAVLEAHELSSFIKARGGEWARFDPNVPLILVCTQVHRMQLGVTSSA